MALVSAVSVERRFNVKYIKKCKYLEDQMVIATKYLGMARWPD